MINIIITIIAIYTVIFKIAIMKYVILYIHDNVGLHKSSVVYDIILGIQPQLNSCNKFVDK